MALSTLPKHMVVTAYVVDGDKVLLLFHRKHQGWLPPGGHMEKCEDPLRALIREFWEETSLVIAPVTAGDPRGNEPSVLMLPTPHHVQVELIDPKHEHVDLVYFCRIISGTLKGNEESEEIRWFTREDLLRYPLDHNVRHFALMALDELSGPDSAA
jgi:8-oxo-dGTP pyrophosphatase MutT (NUDIX family)